MILDDKGFHLTDQFSLIIVLVDRLSAVSIREAARIAYGPRHIDELAVASSKADEDRNVSREADEFAWREAGVVAVRADVRPLSMQFRLNANGVDILNENLI